MINNNNNNSNNNSNNGNNNNKNKNKNQNKKSNNKETILIYYGPLLWYSTLRSLKKPIPPCLVEVTAVRNGQFVSIYVGQLRV